MNTVSTFTRQQYLNNECSHSEYYGQFVNDYVKKIVVGRFSKDKLKKAFDNGNTSFNSPDFKLTEWDGLTTYLRGLGITDKMKPLGDYLTLAGGVCILKEAARQLINE